MKTEKRNGMQYVVPQKGDRRQLAGVAACDIVATGSGLLSLPHSQDGDCLSTKYDVLVVADLVEVIISISELFGCPKFTDACMYVILILLYHLLQGSSGLMRQGALADILYAVRFLMNDGFQMVPGVIKRHFPASFSEFLKVWMVLTAYLGLGLQCRFEYAVVCVHSLSFSQTLSVFLLT